VLDLLVVANKIHFAVCASQFEVPMVGRQPRVNHVSDVNAAVSKNQCAWRLLAAMACVALDTNTEQPLFKHPIIIQNYNVRSACKPPKSARLRRRVQSPISVSPAQR
jgi:hypothetical protein